MAHKNHRRRRRRGAVHRQTLPGATPGLIVPDPESPRPVIRVMAYSEMQLVEREITALSQLEEFLHNWSIVWIDVAGLGDAGLIEKLGQQFNLHRLALEDVVNVHQRSKVEQYHDHLYIVVREAELSGSRIVSDQVSLFLGPKWVVTFQERSGDSFDPVRERIRHNRGRIRSAGADYLTYSLIDAVVDSYFPALEHYGEQLDALEEEVIARGTSDTVRKIHDVRGDLLLMRRTIWPHRDMLAALTRDEHPLIRPETRIYLRDCYDHTIQIIDLVEADRDLCADLRDFYLSTISNRLNEVMKVLTIIATIFIPLSFVAGVYGMNFDTSASPWNMPELRWAYGYPAVLAWMALMAAGMLYYFWRKGWLRD